MLGLFDAWRDRTGGALDASAEAASRVWKTAAAQRRLPADAEIAAAVSPVRQPHWTSRPGRGHGDAPHRRAAHPELVHEELHHRPRGARRAGRATASRGVVVNIGGDLVVARRVDRDRGGRQSASTTPTTPRRCTRLAVRDRAVATSGSYRRGFDIDGRHYSHIVDPRTGRPAAHVRERDGRRRRRASTPARWRPRSACSTPEDSERSPRRCPGAEFLLVLADGGRIQSAGWRALEPPATAPRDAQPPMPALYAAEQATWNPAFELTVTVELAQLRTASVASVRTWPSGSRTRTSSRCARWRSVVRRSPLPAELRAWYRERPAARAWPRAPSIVGSVSSATRSPGRYTFKWDGKDQQGKPVKPGTYTVCIEAAREHGTYQIIRQEMDFSGGAKAGAPAGQCRNRRRLTRLPQASAAEARRSSAPCHAAAGTCHCRLEAPPREVLALAAHLRLDGELRRRVLLRASPA